MVELALNHGKGPVVLGAIAQQQQISQQYLEQLIGPLRVAGLVKSVRGPSGGFVLGRPPALISIGQIIGAIEGSTALVDCVAEPQACPRSADCPTRHVWVKAKAALDGVFDSITLQDLLERKEAGMMLPAGSMNFI
jgi:Rrf2 family protein